MDIKDEILALKREKEELQDKLEGAYADGKAKFYSLKSGVVAAIFFGIGFTLSYLLAALFGVG